MRQAADLKRPSRCRLRRCQPGQCRLLHQLRPCREVNSAYLLVNTRHIWRFPSRHFLTRKPLFQVLEQVSAKEKQECESRRSEINVRKNSRLISRRQSHEVHILEVDGFRCSTCNDVCDGKCKRSIGTPQKRREEERR